MTNSGLTTEELLESILAELRKPKTVLPFRQEVPGYDGSVGSLTINGGDTSAGGLADGGTHCVDASAQYLVKDMYIWNPSGNTGTINIVESQSKNATVIIPIPKAASPGIGVPQLKDVSPSRVYFTITNSPAASDVFYIWWGG